MIALLLMLVLDAYAMDSETVVRKIYDESLSIGMIDHEKRERLAMNDLSLSPFGWAVNFSGTSLRDKSKQDSPASPSDLDNKSFSLGLNKKWSLGITSSFGLSNDNISYTGMNFSTFTPSRYTRNKSALYASLGIDLSQNISGRIDRILLNNHFDQAEIVKMGNKEKLELFLLTGLRSYFQLCLAFEGHQIYKEMVQSANGLLEKSQKRRRGGIVDDRALLIYRSNVSTAQKGELLSRNSLGLASSSFDSFIYDFNYRDGFKDAAVISQKEKSFLDETKNKDVKSLVRKMRKTRVQVKSIEVEKRKENQLSYQRLPNINLSLSVIGTGNEEEMSASLEHSTSLSKPQYLIGVNMSYPLSKSASRASYIAQKNRVQREQLKLKDDLRSRESALRKSIRNLDNLYKLIQVVEKHKKNERAKYLNELKEYQRGRSSARDVVQFQNEYLNSKLNRMQAIVDFKVELNTLLVDLGELSSFYGIGEKR